MVKKNKSESLKKDEPDFKSLMLLRDEWIKERIQNPVEFLGLISEFDCRIEVLVAKQGGDMVRRMISAHRGTVVLNLKPEGGRDEQRFIHWLENEINQIQGIRN